MAGVSFGVFILVNRQMSNAIRTARNRHRHTILLIGSVRFYHPFSFLEPGGRSLFCFSKNLLKIEKAAPHDCFLYCNINFFKGLFFQSHNFFKGLFPADSRFSLSFIWCSMSILRTEQEINSEKTEKREYSRLLEIQDNYPKFVLTTDEFAGGNYEGIKTMHISDFLLSAEY